MRQSDVPDVRAFTNTKVTAEQQPSCFQLEGVGERMWEAAILSKGLNLKELGEASQGILH
jgi:hypothetical protein